MSQLLAQLERDLLSASDPIQRAELLARIAGNLARVGLFDDARKRIGDLREKYGDGHSGRVTVWIMLAEGLIHLYEELSPLALDRITRAQILGIAMRYSTVVALASAWKAHIEFETSKFDAMVLSLNVALTNVGEFEHDAQARIAIVLSNSFTLCGMQDEAQKWFMRGRDHALKNGDQTSIDALLYNRAAFRLAWLRVEHCSRPRTIADLKPTRTEIESARNLQDLARVTALANHIHLWDARLMIIEERFEKAAEKLQMVRNQSPFADYNFSQKFIDLEICFCQFHSGGAEAALVGYQEIGDATLDGLDIDEQIVAEWMRLRLAEADRRFGDPQRHRVLMENLRAAYAETRATLAQSLQVFVRQ